MKTLQRTIHPTIKVLDSKKGIVEYVASDETIDSYKEVIRASGWKFDRFAKNAPFVDSHDYSTVEKLVGRVIEFSVKARQLVEVVQWAIDVADNKLAQLGFAMTEKGYLKAVSVGFQPEEMITRWDAGKAEYAGLWQDQLKELGLTDQTAPRVIYLKQQQVELSSCIIGANANALAKSYKDGILDDSTLEMISLEQGKRGQPASDTLEPAEVSLARQRAREAEFLGAFEAALKRC